MDFREMEEYFKEGTTEKLLNNFGALIESIVVDSDQLVDSPTNFLKQIAKHCSSLKKLFIYGLEIK